MQEDEENNCADSGANNDAHTHVNADANVDALAAAFYANDDVHSVAGSTADSSADDITWTPDMIQAYEYHSSEDDASSDAESGK